MPDMRISRYPILALLALACGFSPAAGALDMFGLALEQSNATTLRAAVKRAGAVLVREGGDKGFDVYRSHTLFPDSQWLFLGFDTNSGDFAFLEYVLDSREVHRWRARLAAKYGQARVGPGRFLSDGAHTWQRDGIRIRLYKDFKQGVLRLEYAVPGRLQQLQGSIPADSSGARNPAFY